ncbi:MAG TPA: DUF4861 domain-containing protein [Prolixibacteraceae bacterium]|nr:DUF4861 domain-containing protein [Prolixibacteraceae bacterium]
MKRLLLFLILPLVTMLSCRKQSGWEIENPLPVDRPDEVIVFQRNEVAAKLAIPGNQLPVFAIDNQLIPSQADDLDGDGQWDEAVVLVNLPASGKAKLVLSFADPGEYPSFEKRTNLRLGILQPDGTFPEVDRYQAPSCRDTFQIIAQAESVNWENDKFGFRVYFDCRNVKDLFGKLQPRMIIDSLQYPGTPSYHDLAPWGMDVLHCGSSLGSGGIALLYNDSLFRLGDTGSYEYIKIAEGPVRSLFELRYGDWVAGDDTLEAVERISITPGKYWFQSEVTVHGLPAGAEIVTGIVTSKLTREPFAFQNHGLTCIGTHDIQSLHHDELGMAVILPENETGKIARTTNINFFERGFQLVKEKNFSNIISETYYVSQKAEPSLPVRHWFAAVWGLEQERWKSEEGFRNYLDGEMEKLAHPLLVKGVKGTLTQQQ